MQFLLDSTLFLAVLDLPTPEQHKIIKALATYPNIPSGEEPESNTWTAIKIKIEEYLEKRERIAQRNRINGAKNAKNYIQEPDCAEPTPAPVAENRFAALTDDPEILSALADPASGLSVFLDTGQGYDDSLTRKECEFADRGDVRALCTWHKEIVAATKAVKKKRPTEPPTLDEWLDFCAEKKLDPDRMRSVYESYSVAHWHDSHGNPILNWKAKILQVWAIDPKNQWRPKANLQKKGRIDEMREASEMAKELLKQRGIKL